MRIEACKKNRIQFNAFQLATVLSKVRSTAPGIVQRMLVTLGDRMHLVGFPTRCDIAPVNLGLTALANPRTAVRRLVCSTHYHYSKGRTLGTRGIWAARRHD
jgi:hypothetical protein